MSQWTANANLAELWNEVSQAKTKVTAVLFCEKCALHSIYSWKVTEEDWKRNFFCPHCQVKYSSKINRGKKEVSKDDLYSNWSITSNREEEAVEQNNEEKWKVAERLMGRARLIKKEDVMDDMIKQRVDFLNTKVMTKNKLETAKNKLEAEPTLNDILNKSKFTVSGVGIGSSL